MEFGLMFFSSSGDEDRSQKYLLLQDAARFADERGFRCLWTPERHFHPFGGLFPNPAVVGAALAAITSRVQIRAGSLISPLHDVVRIAEEWSVVDNLSGGRVAISFGSGWNADDFVFFPDRYGRRQQVMHEQIETVRGLWRGDSVTLPNGAGRPTAVTIYPRPVQTTLPVWVTSSGNVQTFRSAGAVGANLLTHLMGQDLGSLGDKIQQYRAARLEHGFEPEAGIVSLMLHTFVGTDAAVVREIARAPFCEYIKSAVSLEAKAAQGGGAISGGHKIEPHEISDQAMADLLEITFDRYFRGAALMGTPETCKRLVWQLAELGVDEIACLIDFGIAPALVCEGLQHLDVLRHTVSDSMAARTEHSLAGLTEALDA